jgi:predicted DNA-binding protein
MAPPSKGLRVEGKVRMPLEMKKRIKELAETHGQSENDEIVAAIAEHLRRHDPVTCRNLWCVDRRQ